MLVAAVAALAIGPSSFAQPGSPTLGAATPQAALEQLEASIDDGDAARAMAVLTPAGRKLFAKDVMAQTLMLLAFMESDEPMPGGPKPSPEVVAAKKKASVELRTVVTAILTPYGMDGALGQPLTTAEPIVDAGLEKADLIDLTAKTFKAVVKAALALGEDPGTLKLPMQIGPFSALKVEGTTATVKSGPRTLTFENVDGRWFLNAPTPKRAGGGPAPASASTFDLTGSPVRGAAEAPVTLVMFSDFQCGFCQRVNPTLAQLLEQYKGKVRVVFKHLPIEGHYLAPLAHRAAIAADEQGKFWEMHDRLFADQRAMTRGDLLAHAQALGLDVPRFTATMDAERTGAVVARDEGEAERAGVRGTPTFFVNGTPLLGAQPLEAFAAAVDKALAAPTPAPAK
jgi:protein-disulfide isomerase